MTSAHDERPANELPLLELLAEDFATYDRQLSEPGLWAVLAHRVGQRADRSGSRLVRSVLRAGHRVAANTVDFVWGIRMGEGMELGRRVRVWHSGCIDLQAKAIGNDVHIRHDTTLGSLQVRNADPNDRPVIEDNVELGSGVSVLGNVRVGRGSFVGANTLVLKNVAPGATVLGVPARVVPS